MVDQCTNMKYSDFLSQGNQVKEIEINNNYHNTPLLNSQTKINTISNAIPKTDITIDMDHPNQIIPQQSKYHNYENDYDHNYYQNEHQPRQYSQQYSQEVQHQGQHHVQHQVQHQVQQMPHQGQTPYNTPQNMPYGMSHPISHNLPVNQQYYPQKQPPHPHPQQYYPQPPQQYHPQAQYAQQYQQYQKPHINEDGKSEYVEFTTKTGKKVKFIPKKKSIPKKAIENINNHAAVNKKKDDKVINEQVNVETIPIKPE
jgi:hypothetical protein